jgi:hypothetical protein
MIEGGEGGLLGAGKKWKGCFPAFGGLQAPPLPLMLLPLMLPLMLPLSMLLLPKNPKPLTTTAVQKQLEAQRARAPE